MNHFVTGLLATEHLNDLLREAAEGRRSRLVQGAHRSPWSVFSSLLAGLRRRPADDVRRDVPTATSTGTRPAAA